MKIKINILFILKPILFLSALLFCFESPAIADVGEEDAIFGGQILSLTDKKEGLEPSNDPRYQDNQDGTVTDLQEGLMWKKEDSYQEQKKWLNWQMGQTYMADINAKRFGGHGDWKMPTRKQLASLYEEDKNIPWKYYWTVNQVHLDPVFGYTSCCFWSSETHKEEYAWTFNYIRGKAYPSPKGGPGLSLSAIRLVREVSDKERTAQK
jgi:Protein of unknown function (DUF1566)